MKLITNNFRFKNLNVKNIEVEYIEDSYLQVLENVRDYVHKNYELLTHPLYGSVKPNETIYRSILIEEKDKLNYDSVLMMSDAIDTFTKFQKNKKTPEWIETVKDDFSVIDHDLISKAIERII